MLATLVMCSWLLGQTVATGAPAPDDSPTVVRRNGQLCMKTRADDGAVREECVAERPGRSTADEPRRSPFLADFGATVTLAGSLAGPAFVSPGLSLHVALGGRLSDTVGVVGVLDGNAGFGLFGHSLLNVTCAPGVRLGDRDHVTIALGPSVLAFSSSVASSTRVAGSLLVRVVALLSGGFGLHMQAGLTFDASSAFFTVGLGVGGSSFRTRSDAGT